MTPQEVQHHFTHADGSYRFARWVRPIVPVVFGVEDATLAVVKGAIEAMVATVGHQLAETDPEQGANLFLFFLRDWSEIGGIPEMEGLVPGIMAQVPRLEAAGADQYRHFRFEADGAIRACIAFVRMGGPLADLPAADLALALSVQSLLLWSDQAFRDRPALVATAEGAVLRSDIAALLRAAYDPALPAVARDQSHALRLSARTIAHALGNS